MRSSNHLLLIFLPVLFSESTSRSFRQLQMAGRTPSDTTFASTTASAKPATSCAEMARGNLVFGTWLWTANAGWKTRSGHWQENPSSSWREACPTQVNMTQGSRCSRQKYLSLMNFSFCFRYNSDSACTVIDVVKSISISLNLCIIKLYMQKVSSVML